MTAKDLICILTFAINPAYSMDSEKIMASDDPVVEEQPVEEPAVEDRTVSEETVGSDKPRKIS